MGFRSQKFNIKVWDTAGSEKYNTLPKSFFKRAEGIMICFDSTKIESFNNVSKWMEQVDSHAQEDVPKLLVGTKIDLEKQRNVSHALASKFADTHNMYYLECSSQADAGINEAFFLIYDMAILFKFQATKEMINTLSDY